MSIIKEQMTKKHTDKEVLYKDGDKEILSEAATDRWFLSVVLAYIPSEDEYVTLLKNKQTGGYSNGNYFCFLQDSYEKARENFAKRAFNYSGKTF